MERADSILDLDLTKDDITLESTLETMIQETRPNDTKSLERITVCYGNFRFQEVDEGQLNDLAKYYFTPTNN